MLLWTIHDYPRYGLISGCATKGYQGCLVCGPNAKSCYSRSLKKNIFQGHRRYLSYDHPFKFMTQSYLIENKNIVRSLIEFREVITRDEAKEGKNRYLSMEFQKAIVILVTRWKLGMD